MLKQLKTSSLSKQPAGLTLILILMVAVLKAQSPVKIALFDTPPGTEHGDRVHRELKKKLKKCSSCTIVRYEFFNQSGAVDVVKMTNLLKELPRDISLLHLSWNVPFDEKYQPVIEQIKKLLERGVTVVAAAGESQHSDEINREIKDTVMGKIPGVILVGELNKKGRLPINAFYGPEISKSYPTDPQNPGSSFTSLIETAKRATELSQRSKR